ncbi:hypothetical protein [Brevundimonas sp. GCM10030266]|uniref:hypothetical protein n=1 Tax=Brevundimonas sp. GCM10030266 TaxID=3273386 RepID=UPI00361FDCBB
MPAPVPWPPAVIEVSPDLHGWRMTSSDGLFFGLFADRASAVRYARDEADGHPGHVVVVRDPTA